MTTRSFGMGFLGRNLFNKEERKQFQEKWSKMTDGEKLEFMNNRVESMGQDHFSMETINAHCEEWMKMPTEEKQVFADEWKQAFENRMSHKRILWEQPIWLRAYYDEVITAR
ncbi:MAG: hypothetical protein LBL90_09425 [Prevotellaceae bacterium]|jgi:hypothetical protein|nr:hypothetical protein [Prevotellaceae bacterium]